MRNRLEVIPEDSWATEVAAVFAERVERSLRVCLPTGDTVRTLYHVVAKETSLDGVSIFLLDEFGGLPKNDPGRCETMIRSDLLDRASGSPSFSLPDVDAADPAEAALRYAAQLADGGIDLAVVGLGANGHVGMNEPGTTDDLRTRVVTLAPSTIEHAATYGATSAPTWGITVGVAELLEARELWLLVTGSHKREILARALDGPIGPAIPASLLRAHPNFTVFADDAASLKLSRG